MNRARRRAEGIKLSQPNRICPISVDTLFTRGSPAKIGQLGLRVLTTNPFSGVADAIQADFRPFCIGLARGVGVGLSGRSYLLMPTIDERLRHVTLKIKRAEKHIADLEQQLRAFLDTTPYKVGTKHDSQTRKLIYYVTSIKPVPDCLPLVAGDVIQNLMSSLDHLAYQIVCSDTKDHPPNPNWIYFPIADDAAKYEAKKREKMRGARQETFDAIDALKPYKGGNDLLWALYRLNNVEKHRLLLTVGSQAAGVNVAQDVARRMAGGSFSPEALAALASMSLFLRPADSGFPLKEGFELFIGAVGEEPNPHQQFGFNVALNEPGIIEGAPLLETLHQLKTLVERIVAALATRLK